MNDRQKELFQNIVREYVESARAVGSEFLAEKYDLGVSSATIRNDMVELEDAGLIYQPHTSAGRVPTERGFNYFIKNYLSNEGKISEKDKNLIKKAKQNAGKMTENIGPKNVVKVLAELSEVAAVYCLGRHNTYYTGLSNLLTQPEFYNFNLVQNIAAVADNIDEVVDRIFDQIEETEIRIGKENHFSPMCASIFTKKDGQVLGLIGPMRMNYERNLGLINFAKELLN
ncbi:DeoR family transcriptional regulator [Candidatus Kuenenbacteria bacterium]|nr:DeoR family transcriptional regulator [Candidatus Kuenenbacteria bacterium]